MARPDQDNNHTHLIGLIAGIATAAILVATGAVIYKIISDQEKTETDTD